MASTTWGIGVRRKRISRLTPEGKNRSLTFAARMWLRVFRAANVRERLSSEPEQIADLGEELAPRGGRWKTDPRHRGRSAGEQSEVFQPVGVADVQGRAGVDEVRQQHVAGNTLLPLQVDEQRVLEDSVVIQNQAQRKLARELIVEPRPNQVVDENRGRAGHYRERSSQERVGARPQAREVVDLVELQPRHGPQCELRLQFAAIAAEGVQGAGSIVVDARAPGIAAIER